MFRLRIYFVIGILGLLTLGTVASRPYAFQKLNTVVPVEGFEPLHASPQPVDIAGIIESAPFVPGTAVTADPARKYRLTIEQGTGNCSERAFGLAWKLRQSGVDLQIVHLLPHAGFVRGEGHTVIRIPYAMDGSERVGVVDLLEGGLPTDHGEPLDIDELSHGAIDDASIRSLTPLQDDESSYYGEFLDRVSIGFIPAREIDPYFEFIERVYVPLGNDRLEKYVYDGLALLVGVLPETHVPEYQILVEDHTTELWLHRSALWIMRSLIFVIPAILVFEIGLRLFSGRRTSTSAKRPVS